MFQQIGGFIGDLFPLGIFVYFILVHFDVIKMKNKPKMLENPPKYLKVVAVLGVICFIFLIVVRIVELMR